MVSQPQGIYRWLSGRALWATSAALCAFCFVPLSLPYLFGTGSGATWDWGFLYVTLRFVALPLACAVYFVYAVLVAWRSKGAIHPRPMCDCRACAFRLQSQRNPRDDALSCRYR